MNTSKSFFSSSLKRQQRARAKRLAEICHLTPSKPELQVIVEDAEESEDPRPSCSSWTTASSHGRMTPELKKRKATKLSDIRVPRDATSYVPHEDEDILEINSSLLSAPRPAPRPPTSPLSSSGSRSSSPARTTSPSPNPSPDSFRLTFGDKSTFKFPHPPVPTPSSSNRHFASPYSSPSSESTGLPLTPGSSDTSDDDELPSQRTTLRRLKSIKPLTIVKRDASYYNSGFISASPSKSDVGGDSLEFKNFFANSPAPSSLYSPSNSTSSFADSPMHDIFSPRSQHTELPDEDDLSDSEWYTKELSSLLTLRSAMPQSLIRHSAQNRPESFYARPESEYVQVPRPASPTPPAGSRGSRLSKPLPKLPSAQLDPAYPYAERRRSFLLPSRPPPPPPTKAKESRPRPPSLALRRPPPRSSIPADFLLEDGTDADSAISLVDFYTGSPVTASAPSSYSQASAEAEFVLYSPPEEESESSPASSADSTFEFDFEVEVDAPMMLPLSLPNSPLMDIDFLEAVGEEDEEAEELDMASQFRGPTIPLPPVPETEPETQEESVVRELPLRQATPPPSQPQLRSRWSSSTLSSVHEEHKFAGLRSPLSSKFRFFGAPRKSLDAKPKPTPKKVGSTNKKQRGVVVVGPTMFSPVSPGPMSPVSPRTPPPRSHRHRGHAHSYAAFSPRAYDSPSSFSFSSSSDSPMSPTSPSPKYPSPKTHVRRRPSTSTVSSSSACSSCDSELSVNSGLRRKPIPVEMFLRASMA
ncbi:hypothetical protein VNI00_002203 [Paramarasmius palmivorus]|uniref:Uncharacterized protein n=1 Tax=Paramarasmius palmivorus TaxID=297713 RepID=A0AAW0E3Z8_9AGAR